jgi:hypothetical protein
MPREVLIMGRGPSFDQIDLSQWKCQVAVISSTAQLMTAPFGYWFGVDDRSLFDPVSLERIDQHAHAIHIPATSMGWEASNVVRWPMINKRDPQDGQIVSGRLAERAREGFESFVEHHTMLFAVQVLYLLGYKHLIFGGCDMLDQYSHVVVATLQEWYQMRPADVQWFNLSSLSYLANFVPPYHAPAVQITEGLQRGRL